MAAQSGDDDHQWDEMMKILQEFVCSTAEEVLELEDDGDVKSADLDDMECDVQVVANDILRDIIM
jgi:hypothetical protein